MKKYFLIPAILLLFVAFGQAQHRNGLKGPKAKNYKPWKDTTKSSATLVTYEEPANKLKGPEAKNYKKWQDKGVEKNTILVSTGDTKKLKGPAAKNHKVWKDNS
ncbi:MAG: hypothetical protein RIG77_23065 [Cyclobacteriaceae bacterium]